MKYLNYIYKNIRKIVLVYTILILVFVFWIVFLVMREANVKSVSQVPAYSENLVGSVSQRLGQRTYLNVRGRVILNDSDYGKDEPFR
jgi:hypothetical protein